MVLMIVAIPLLMAACSGETDLEPVQEVTLGDLPDVVPVENMAAYFERDDLGNLLVQVKNQGNKAAKNSWIRVDFDTGSHVESPTEILEVESFSFKTPISITPNSWDPDSNFTITVDAFENVTESNEDNNVVNGVCIG